MAEFTKNFFLSPKNARIIQQSVSPSQKKTNANKNGVCLYLAKIIESKINKQASYGLGKIMMEGMLNVPYQKVDSFDRETESSFLSTQMPKMNLAPIGTPQNPEKLHPMNPASSGSRLLKKRSSLNQTRPISPAKSTCESTIKMNIERTYQSDESEQLKQLNGLKMMQLSTSTRTILQKVSRYDKKNYAFEIQKLCLDQFSSEMRKLEKVKNSCKDFRGQIYDNQLTLSVICSNIVMMSALSKEVLQLRKQNEQKERQLKRKNDQDSRQHRSQQKLEKHLGNVDSQIKIYMNRIEENLGRRDLHKALIGINDLIKRYENESFAKERVYFYSLIKDRINDQKDVQKCLDEVCRILGVLCIADLNQTEACLRSLKANHTAFKYIKKTYGNPDKFYGNQMTNIIHNLLKFNNNIIQYLQAKKEIEKQVNKPTGIEQMKKEHSLEIAALNTKLDEYKRKVALLQVEIEKKNFKLNNLGQSTSQSDRTKKAQIQFEKRMTDIMQGISSKKDYKKELQQFRKSSILLAEKPYAQFIKLIASLQRANQERIKQQIQSLSTTFTEIGNVFRKDFDSQQSRFKEINKLLDASSMKNVFYFDLHRFIQSLMFTIVQKTKEDVGDNKSQRSDRNKMEQVLNFPQERKRQRRHSQKFDDIKFQISTFKGGMSCVDPKESPARSVGFYDEKEQDLGEFNEKQLLKKIELFLNKVSPILHSPKSEMDEKLTQVEELSEKFIIENYKYKEFFTVLENWMSFAISRLELKTKI